MTTTFRVAVVGSGPAGMYAIEHMLGNSALDIEIDIYEKLTNPWGLVRTGVAPDHPEKKMVVNRVFDYYLNRPQVSYFGNVEVGVHVTTEQLARWYDAVIYATGASADVTLGIEGEQLPGCLAAREFVAWYNGHPGYADLDVDLTGDRAVIVGNGNVAMDIARILTLPVAQLETTDIADHALDALRRSKVREVVVLGRRSYLEAAFHSPELEELEHLDGVDIEVEPGDGLSLTSGIGSIDDWKVRRKVETLARLQRASKRRPRKTISLRFLQSPVAMTGRGRVERILVAHNRLVTNKGGKLMAEATGDVVELETGLVLRSIGYRAVPFPGLPFDGIKHVISNEGGRVTQDGEVMPGVYVTGWVKHGPRGVIGTNKQCALETVTHLLSDIFAGQINPHRLSRTAVTSLVQQHQPEVIDRTAWHKLDGAEVSAGRKLGRPRQKIIEYDHIRSIVQ